MYERRRKMTFIRIVLIAVITLIISAVIVSPVAAQINLPYTTNLLINDHNEVIDAGDVTMNVYGMLSFNVEGSGTGWLLEETRVYIGDEPPVKIKVADFQYVHEGLGGAGSDVFYLDLRAADLNGDGIVYISAWAEVTSQVSGTSLSAKKVRTVTDTAMGQGEASTGKGKNQISYFSLMMGG
jgi:hypothetical protein